jgi:hypothetical protein
MNEWCECEGPGWCKRHGVEKLGREFKLCRGIDCTVKQCAKYWNAWERGKFSNQKDSPSEPLILGNENLVTTTTNSGPGTELKKIIKSWIGEDPLESCPCEDYLATMDAWGCDRCKEKIDTIVAWLVLEGQERKWKFSSSIAGMVAGSVARLPIAGDIVSRIGAKEMIKLAIKRAEALKKKAEEEQVEEAVNGS